MLVELEAELQAVNHGKVLPLLARDRREDLDSIDDVIPRMADALHAHTPRLTRRELAVALGVHVMTITKWERSGMPVAERGRRGRPSRYLEADVREWVRLREDAAKQAEGPLDLAQERARQARAQAQLAEQTYQVRTRELLPAAEVERVWAAEVAAVRTLILASYTTHADRVYRAATLHGVAGVERELKAIAHEILRELSQGAAAAEPAPPAAAATRHAGRHETVETDIGPMHLFQSSP